MERCKYTVVMPVFNATGVVGRTLNYLIHTGVSPENILVMDDCSDDPDMENISAWAKNKGIRWQRSARNMGYTLNCNRGLRSVSTEFALLLNSDCFISKTSIESLSLALQNFDSLGCAGPLSSKAGHQTVQLSRDIHWQSLTSIEIEKFTDSIEARLEVELGLRPWIMPTVNGFCCLWRMSTLKEIDFLDENEFPAGYGEEDDACLRVVNSGRFCAIVPYVFAPHLKTKSFTISQRNELKVHAQNRLRMKYSNTYIDRVIRQFERHPRMVETRQLRLGTGSS